LDGIPGVALAGLVVRLVITGALFATSALLNAPTGFENLQIVAGPFLTKLMLFNVALAGQRQVHMKR
jgi:hypothetical protein